MKYLITLSAFVLFIITACKKETVSDEQQMHGTWIRVGTNGSGPAGTLVFSEAGGNNMLQFDCSGSPGPGWPSTANSIYSFQNGKLSFVEYSNSSGDIYTADSFTWITRGEEFEIKLRHLLLFMSADYTVRFKKTN